MERKYTFNDVVLGYAKYRPGYPKALFTDIVEYASLALKDSILEVGCGTGLATEGFIELGYTQLTAIELGDQLAEHARQKFKEHAEVKIINTAFERWLGELGAYKLAISATAFHFIEPQEWGYRKVHELLSPGGTLAFFWTVHVPGKDEVHHAIRDCYQRHAPELDDTHASTVEEIVQQTSDKITHASFHSLTVEHYAWEDEYTGEDYVALLNTNSRHRILPDEIRNKLLVDIKDVIDRHGGFITKPRAVALFLAKK